MQGGQLRIAANPKLVPKAHMDKVGDVYKVLLNARKALIEQAEFLLEYGYGRVSNSANPSKTSDNASLPRLNA